MLQLAIALHHCWDRGVFHNTYMSNILINTDTLQLKIMDFRLAEHIIKKRELAFYLYPYLLQFTDNALMLKFWKCVVYRK